MLWLCAVFDQVAAYLHPALQVQKDIAPGSTPEPFSTTAGTKFDRKSAAHQHTSCRGCWAAQVWMDQHIGNCFSLHFSHYHLHASSKNTIWANLTCKQASFDTQSPTMFPSMIQIMQSCWPSRTLCSGLWWRSLRTGLSWWRPCKPTCTDKRLHGLLHRAPTASRWWHQMALWDRALSTCTQMRGREGASQLPVQNSACEVALAHAPRRRRKGIFVVDQSCFAPR